MQNSGPDAFNTTLTMYMEVCCIAPHCDFQCVHLIQG